MRSYIILAATATIAKLAAAEQRFLADENETDEWIRCRAESRSGCGEAPALGDRERRPPDLDCQKDYDDPRCNLQNGRVG